MDSTTSMGASLAAANVYLSLLLSPNSPVFTLFTPVAFLSLLRSIRCAVKNPPQGFDVQVKGKRRARGKARGTRKEEREAGELGGEETGFDVKMLVIVMKKLESVLGLIHLNRFPDSLKSLVQTIVGIPVSSIELGGLMDLCGRILSKLMRSEHGTVEDTAAEVLKALTPLILMGKCQGRTFAVGFVKNQMMGMAKQSEEVKKAVVYLPKYLANKAPEKAEPRGLAVEAIMEIVNEMEMEDRVTFAEYITKLSFGKTSLRLLAVDLISTMMMSMKDPFGVYDSSAVVEDSWGFKCLEALIQRCSDSDGGIRARALLNLAQLVGFFLNNDKNRLVLKQVIEPEDGEVNRLLRRRCMDEKAMVRRATLLLITKVTGFLGGSIDGVILKTMGISCSDPLISIRKAAITALSEVSSLLSVHCL